MRSDKCEPGGILYVEARVIAGALQPFTNGREKGHRNCFYRGYTVMARIVTDALLQVHITGCFSLSGPGNTAQ